MGAFWATGWNERRVRKNICKILVGQTTPRQVAQQGAVRLGLVKVCAAAMKFRHSHTHTHTQTHTLTHTHTHTQTHTQTDTHTHTDTLRHTNPHVVNMMCSIPGSLEEHWIGYLFFTKKCISYKTRRIPSGHMMMREEILKLKLEAWSRKSMKV